jgi:uncharacterized protein (TIRG00374 family)
MKDGSYLSVLLVMRKKIKETVKVVLGLIVAVGSLLYVMRNVSIGELIESFSMVNSEYFIPAVFLLTLSYLARAYRWRALLLPFKKIKVTEVYFTMMTGFLGNVLPLRAGELLRAYILKRKQDITISGALATILMEWIFDIFLLLILFAWVFQFYTEVFDFTFPVSGLSSQDIASYFARFCLVLIIGLVLFVHSFLQYKTKIILLVEWISSRLPSTWKKRIKYFLEDLSSAFYTIKEGRIFMQVIFFSSLEWFLTILSFYPMFLAYNLGPPSLSSLVILTVMIVMFTTVFPAPGFLGSFNAGVYVALHHLLGASEVLSANFGWMAWGLNFFVIFLSGVYFILKNKLSLRAIWKG